MHVCLRKGYKKYKGCRKCGKLSVLLAGSLAAAALFPVTVLAAEGKSGIMAEYRAYEERFSRILVIDDITLQGYEIIERHVFDIPLVKQDPQEGMKEGGPQEVTRPEDMLRIDSQDAVALQETPTVRFFPAIDGETGRAAVFLADGEGRIVYKCNQLECNYTVRGELDQPIVDMVSVAFQDVNHDQLIDLILIAGCVNETGEYAGKMYKVGEVLFQSPDNDLATGGISFYRDWRINDKLNRFDMNKSAQCIITFVRDGRSTEFLYTATTQQELISNGFHVIEEQSYWRNYEKLGRLKVLPGYFSIANFDIFMIYMVNEQGDIVWSFQPMGDYENLYSLKGMSGGKDMDGDGMKDLVVLARYSKTDENGEMKVDTCCSVYYQRTSGFDIDSEFVDSYTCTGSETMSELVSAIRGYWGWQEEEGVPERADGSTYDKDSDSGR